jgi:hypothetical protein
VRRAFELSTLLTLVCPGIGIERAAVAGQEQRLRARVQGKTRTHGLQVMLQPVNRPLADGHDAIFFPFAQADVERATFGVEVGQFHDVMRHITGSVAP